MQAETAYLPPKMVRFAEAELAVMLADGMLDQDRIATWDAWRDAPGRPGDGAGRLGVPGPVAELFREALARQAGRLERRLAETDDPDDANDLAMLRSYLRA